MRIWSWRAAILKTPLAAPTKLLLLTLATYMNDHGEGCYPSIDTLASDTSLSRRAIIRHLRLAKDAGFLNVTKHGFRGQKWARNDYVATYPARFSDDGEAPEKGSAPDAPPLQKAVHEVQKGGDSNDTKVVHQVHSNSPSNSPKNSIHHHPTTPEPREADVGGDGAKVFGKIASKVQEMIASPVPLSMAIVHSWLAAGAVAEFDIYPEVERVLAIARQKSPDFVPSGMKYFDRAVRQAIADRLHREALPEPSKPSEAKPESDMVRARKVTEEALRRVFGDSLD